MWLLTEQGSREGAYAVKDIANDKVLFLFEQEDDAERYCMHLELFDYPKLKVLEIDDELMIKTCELHEHRYTVITTNDVVIPPDNAHDFV